MCYNRTIYLMIIVIILPKLNKSYDIEKGLIRNDHFGNLFCAGRTGLLINKTLN